MVTDYCDENQHSPSDADSVPHIHSTEKHCNLDAIYPRLLVHLQTMVMYKWLCGLPLAVLQQYM